MVSNVKLWEGYFFIALRKGIAEKKVLEQTEFCKFLPRVRASNDIEIFLPRQKKIIFFYEETKGCNFLPIRNASTN